ncbi:leukocyte elastase inhibitor-like [Zophobas morio]|uniref:leukocyte elastase inhibitor-like n=1 Tax=Zophobas morio TaxID=2755281 RepID=UPI003083814D
MAKTRPELEVLKGITQFTTDLYKVLAKTPGNVIFSPISVHAVLSMSYQGAKGTTAEKFASTLKVPAAAAAAEGYNFVMNRLNSVPNVTLLMANKIFLKKSYQLLPEFSNAVSENFLSEVQLLNFAANEAAAASINAWVKEKTKDKIKDIINKDNLDESTRLILVNAIYFKGNWAIPFHKNSTKTAPFYLIKGDKVNVPMMNKVVNLYYKADKKLDVQILELPYTNENLSMIIILPNKRNGLDKLEKKLASCKLMEIMQQMWKVNVIVQLPRFKIEQTIFLNDPLTKLGLGEIFDPHAANFGGMITSNEQLFVSQAVQKAFIEVNEEGAEAAAATLLEATFYCGGRSGPPPPKKFIADHPFIYFLCENRINPLFAGRLSDPRN